MTTKTQPMTGSAVTETQPMARSRLRALRDAAGAVAGAVMGLLPHVMHHIGLIAGAALVTGVAGNAAFFVIGLLLSLPLLRRLHRRFRTLWAPAIAVAAFTALFSLSAFVIGPALTGGSVTGNPPGAPASTTVDDHAAHHTGK